MGGVISGLFGGNKGKGAPLGIEGGQPPNITPGVGVGAPPPPAPAAPITPALPDLADPAIQAAREKERKPKGRAGTILTGSQGLLSSPFLARRVLLGS